MPVSAVFQGKKETQVRELSHFKVPEVNPGVGAYSPNTDLGQKYGK